MALKGRLARYAPPAPAPMEAPGLSHRPRLLIIGRSSGIHQIVRAAFAGRCDVIHAYSGFLAVARLQQQEVDLIVAVLDMPREYRGTRLLDTIRQTEGGRKVPVLVLLSEEQLQDARLQEALTAAGVARCSSEIQRFDEVRAVAEQLLETALAARDAA